jgi:hypothetical protein
MEAKSDLVSTLVVGLAMYIPLEFNSVREAVILQVEKLASQDQN